MTFSDFIAQKLGTRGWVVAGRLTLALQRRGYTVAVSQKKFSAFKLEFAA